MKNFGTELKSSFVKPINSVTKEAAKEHTDIIGEDFMTFLENPLQNSYDIHLKGDYVIKDSIAKLKLGCVKHHDLRYVYDKQLVNLKRQHQK
jgi:cell division transport system permease protein